MEDTAKNKMTKEQKEQLKNILKLIIYVTPFFLGWYGTYQLGEGDWIDCAYKTVQLYLMEYGLEAEKLNLATQIARITAPIMTAAFIASLLHFLIESVQIWFCLKTRDAVAFHGDSANIDEVKEKLGKRAIVSEKPMAFRAKKHVLMFEEDVDMYHYIDQHASDIMHGKENEEKEIFLCSEKILRGCYENSKIIVCNVAENCARSYWEKYPIKMEKDENGKDVFVNEKILFIGFDNYAQRLLTQAILKNVVSDESAIEYHICGKFTHCGTAIDKDEYANYLDTHLMLHKAVNVKKVTQAGEVVDIRPREDICENQDTVYFHEASWQKVMGRGTEFDRIIICKDLDAENMEILNELKTFFVVGDCHIKYTDERILKGLWNCEKDGIYAFGVNEDLYDPEVILKEKLFDNAKKIHARYFANHPCKGICNGVSCQNQTRVPVLDEKTGAQLIDEKGEAVTRVEEVKNLDVCVQCPALLADWNKQNNFIRYSNVSQADHMPEKLRLLLGASASMEDEKIGEKAVAAYLALPAEEQEKLWKIEHIRWDRYHFMNNWDHAKERDNAKRRHNLLVCYEELDMHERSKDAAAYLSLAEILATGPKKQ